MINIIADHCGAQKEKVVGGFDWKSEGCGGMSSSSSTRLTNYNLHPHLVVYRAALSHINAI